MSNKETAKEIFDTGVDNEDGRDTIIVSMVQAGVSLNSAQNWYTDFAREAGMINPRVGHKKEALEFLAEEGIGEDEILDNDNRAELRSTLSEKFGVAVSTANDYIKAYAKQEGIELPTSNFGGNPEDQGKIYDWIVANKDADKPAFKEFMEAEMGRSPGSIDETWRGVLLARKLQADGVVFAE